MAKLKSFQNFLKDPGKTLGFTSLLSTSFKIEKGEKFGYLSTVMYMSPSWESGHNMCAFASPNCADKCLGKTSGYMSMPTHKRARIARTDVFWDNRELFTDILIRDIETFLRKAERMNMIPCARLNGATDRRWEEDIPEVFDYPIQWYDYTKDHPRMIEYLDGNLPPNYHLTFSRSEENEPIARYIAELGGNVAVVFADANYPNTYWDIPIVSGEESDLRFKDPPNRIVALKARGGALKDHSGFVVRDYERVLRCA
jgi:hypothetical protein